MSGDHEQFSIAEELADQGDQSVKQTLRKIDIDKAIQLIDAAMSRISPHGCSSAYGHLQLAKNLILSARMEPTP